MSSGMLNLAQFSTDSCKSQCGQTWVYFVIDDYVDCCTVQMTLQRTMMMRMRTSWLLLQARGMRWFIQYRFAAVKRCLISIQGTTRPDTRLVLCNCRHWSQKSNRWQYCINMAQGEKLLSRDSTGTGTGTVLCRNNVTLVLSRNIFCSGAGPCELFSLDI